MVYDKLSGLSSILALDPLIDFIFGSRNPVIDWVHACVQRIVAYDKLSGLNSILALNPAAQAEAAALDIQLQTLVADDDPLPSLFCVPFIVKDLYDLVGLPSTAGSVALADNLPYRDAAMVGRRERGRGTEKAR